MPYADLLRFWLSGRTRMSCLCLVYSSTGSVRGSKLRCLSLDRGTTSTLLVTHRSSGEPNLSAFGRHTLHNLQLRSHFLFNFDGVNIEGNHYPQVLLILDVGL